MVIRLKLWLVLGLTLVPLVKLNAQSGGSSAYSNPSIQSQQQTLGVNVADQNLIDSIAIQVPTKPFDLTQDEESYLLKLLDFWQQSSERVKQYVCQFERFEYDSEIVNFRDPQNNTLAAATIARGIIKYAAPDRGYYETLQTWGFTSPPTKPGGNADYDEIKGTDGKEKWICDGRFIYEFDFKQKVLYEEEIPKELRGERIVDSPLPFLFGARRDDVLQRYWIRPTPQPNGDEYWLEAYPKRIEDSRMYSKVEIVLAREDFLPKAIHVYSPQYDPQKGNFQSRYFRFERREVNSQLARIQDFFDIFVRPQTPPFEGWRRMERMPMYQEQQAMLPGDRK